MFPVNEITRQFALSPWHELRRQVMLFLLYVEPDGPATFDTRVAPPASIDERCDEWITTFVSAKNRKGVVPPDDLRKWLGVRGRMALSLIDYERRNEETLDPPDLQNQFAAEMVLRLIVFWHHSGKDAWLNPELYHPGNTLSE